MMTAAKVVSDLQSVEESLTSELNELKKKRGAGRPRGDNPDEKKIRALEAELAFMRERGRRPTAEDLANPPPPEIAVTAKAVIDDPEHHTPVVSARRAMAAAASKPADDAHREDSDDEPPEDDDAIAKELNAALAQACRTPDAQKVRNKVCAAEFAASRLDGTCKGKPFMFPPPSVSLDADLQTRADNFGLCSVVVWHPPSSFGTAELPCPRCGWDDYTGSDKTKMMTKIHDWTPGRRVFDVDWDVYLVGAVIHCRRCKANPERIALVKELADAKAKDDRDAQDKGEAKATKPSERTTMLNAQLSAMPYSFRSYDPAVMKMYCER